MNWISINDRLPELIGDVAGPETREVIVFGDNGQWAVAVYNYETDSWFNNRVKLSRITHWCDVTPPTESL